MGPWHSAHHALPTTQVDGWTDLQEQLDNRNLALSRTFTIIFILLATFIFLSMFVGVMIIHTEVRLRSSGWPGWRSRGRQSHRPPFPGWGCVGRGFRGPSLAQPCSSPWARASPCLVLVVSRTGA